MTDMPPQIAPTETAAKNEDTLRGFGFALAAYVFWGFLPVFMKALAHISPFEVLAHRVIWSIPIAAAVLVWQGRTADLKRAIRTPRMLLMAAVTAVLVSVNWGIYVWAIGAGHALDTALGYYINPLFSVFLGAALLGERLNRAQQAAIALAVLAVLIMTIEAGRLPFVALALMLSWGIYAYLKKSLPIGPNQGFLLEVLLLSPFAVAYIGWLIFSGQSHFLQGVPFDSLMLLACGFVTAVPLMLYANGAKLLRLSTIGMMQYIPPTMILLTAILIFDEPIGMGQAIAFPMIWLALLIYSVAMLRGARRGS